MSMGRDMGIIPNTLLYTALYSVHSGKLLLLCHVASADVTSLRHHPIQSILFLFSSLSRSLLFTVPALVGVGVGLPSLSHRFCTP